MTRGTAPRCLLPLLLHRPPKSIRIRDDLTGVPTALGIGTRVSIGIITCGIDNDSASLGEPTKATSLFHNVIALLSALTFASTCTSVAIDLSLTTFVSLAVAVAVSVSAYICICTHASTTVPPPSVSVSVSVSVSS